MSRILRLPCVIQRVGLKKSTIYKRIKLGEFPAPISLGARAVGWLESEIDDWLAARIDVSRVDREQSLALDRQIVRREAGQ